MLALASAVPVMVGIKTLVRLSPGTPLSLLLANTGAGGAATLLSIDTDTPLLAAETLPAASVCLAVSVWLPVANVALEILQLPAPSATVVPSKVAPSVSYSLIVALASAEPTNTGVWLLVIASLFDLPVSVPAVMTGTEGDAGAVWSTVYV